ncbi:MAG: hypothetical protein E3J72_09985 [Planctomycetota bacterium]|nr:MAG: hypothetical protein E3J72_09985 [Planctomycetota bacterium]
MSLKDELEYFIQNQDELVKKYNGKVVVIKDKQVVGSFEKEAQAFIEMSKKFKPGTFAIYKCISGPQAYSITVNSTRLFA